ncbi:MAG: hypothetical protein Ct9H90mP16_11140 [Candidatus Poseidoniales archaeon]|nr:MAG: hypothetical protein Ct9H90mP16_11140 [Candidatus Poseidoniales archaeon]
MHHGILIEDLKTVTYLLEGRMQHEDSAGNKGELNPGDVQWMTAGRGIVHSEEPHEEFQKNRWNDYMGSKFG